MSLSLQLQTDIVFPGFSLAVEIRGGPRTVKKQTSVQKAKNDTIDWEEQLALECLEGANELRILLCRQKHSGERQGTSIVAACGIYMKDILDAVPIDKYFELFKPGAGAEGGFIRVSINHLLPDQVRKGDLLPKQKGGFPFIPLLLAVAAGGAAAYYATQNKKEEEGKDKKNDKNDKKPLSLFGKK